LRTKRKDYNYSEAGIHKLCVSLVSNLYDWSVNGTSIGVVSGLDGRGIELMKLQITAPMTKLVYVHMMIGDYNAQKMRRTWWEHDPIRSKFLNPVQNTTNIVSVIAYTQYSDKYTQ